MHVFLLHFRPFQAISSIWYGVSPLCFWTLQLRFNIFMCKLEHLARTYTIARKVRRRCIDTNWLDLSHWWRRCSCSHLMFPHAPINTHYKYVLHFGLAHYASEPFSCSEVSNEQQVFSLEPPHTAGHGKRPHGGIQQSESLGRDMLPSTNTKHATMGHHGTDGNGTKHRNEITHIWDK